MEKFFNKVDERKTYAIDKLREAVEIKSVSSDFSRFDRVVQMAQFLEKWVKDLGGEVSMVDVGNIKDGETTYKLPPIVEATFGKDPKKKTVCVYGHYDVQPAELSDGWLTDPWKLIEKDEKLYGRGSTDDKGPMLAWLLVVEYYKELKMELPVNLKMCMEGMEESGSEGLDDYVHENVKPNKFLHDVDYFCISDNYWLGSDKPCITYGLRGIAYFYLEVLGSSKDLHSGVHGGNVYEPMIDLVHILSKLVEPSGKILVPGIYDNVAPLTTEEESTYKDISFDVDTYKKDIGVQQLRETSKEKILQNRWRNPTCTIHGVEGAFYGCGAKTVIPAKVIGKFSFRLVPDMDPVKIESLVKDYLVKEWGKLGSPNTMKVYMTHGAKAWVSDPNHVNYKAGRHAIEKVFKQKPDLTREGGSIPITLTFEEASGKNVLLLPIGAGDDGAHSQNEKINVRNYIEGIKLLGAYLDEISKLST
eukprot:TRINITY_DN2374_c0_g1_i1.p1 TRINITY_DN2374_c0_g1~~TRINITY_DN2374_c0_g1_i1.p1  ORF type:complete len:474 (-),score=111.41 TRINITY_DN2374_c0_g1_i1:39-1460(-)